MHVCVYIYTYIYLYICIYIYDFYVYVHIYIQIYVFIFMYIYISMYIYICIGWYTVYTPCFFPAHPSRWAMYHHWPPGVLIIQVLFTFLAISVWEHQRTLYVPLNISIIPSLFRDIPFKTKNNSIIILCIRYFQHPNLKMICLKKGILYDIWSQLYMGCIQ